MYNVQLQADGTVRWDLQQGLACMWLLEAARTPAAGSVVGRETCALLAHQAASGGPHCEVSLAGSSELSAAVCSLRTAGASCR